MAPKRGCPDLTSSDEESRTAASGDDMSIDSSGESEYESGSDDEPTVAATKEGTPLKKPRFQRLWSDEDEIKLLQGMIKFHKKKKLGPTANVHAFKDFLHKRSVRFGFLASESQICNKIRKMKIKFKNRCKTGRIGKKPHDQKVAELSRVLWGSGGKKSKTPASASKIVADLSESPEEFEDGEWASISSQLQLSSTGLEQKVLRIGMGMIGSLGIEKLKEKWRQLRMSELQVDNDRAMLVNHQAKVIMDGYRRACVGGVESNRDP